MTIDFRNLSCAAMFRLMNKVSRQIGIPDSSMVRKMNWFFLNESDGAKQGPFSIYEMERYATRLAIRPRTKVWHESLGQWTSAWLVKEIFSRRPLNDSSRIILGPGMPVQVEGSPPKSRGKISGKKLNIAAWSFSFVMLILTLLLGMILNVEGGVGLLAFGYFGLPMLGSLLLLMPISIGLGCVAYRRGYRKAFFLTLSAPIVAVAAALLLMCFSS